jgi:hypothetical protein
MKQLNSIIYHKLLLQAEEAREQGLVKLADSIVEAVGKEPVHDLSEYSYSQMQEDMHRGLWKLATHVLHYYNLESVDAEKLDQNIIVWALKIVDDLEKNLNVDSVVKGPLESDVPGESK